MLRKPSIFVAVVFFVIAGCTRAQMRSQQMTTDLKQAGAVAKACNQKQLVSDLGKRLNKVFIMKENDPRAIEKMSIS